MKIVISSGGFDPIHKGHIEYLQKAKTLGDYHIVIVNNDNFLKLKKGKPFMDEEGRLSIIRELKSVDMAILALDKDLTVCKTIEKIYETWKCDPEALTPNEFIFAKGGDRFKGEIPETKICEKYNIKIIDGLGEKIESSSKLLKNV